MQHAIGSWKRAQTLDPNQRRENCPSTLNLTLDLEHAHVSGYSTVMQGIRKRAERRSRAFRLQDLQRRTPEGIVNLSGRGMLLVSVTRQLGSGNSFACLLWYPLKPSGTGKGALGPRS